MKWFMNLRIAAKLISSFVLVALIAGCVGMVGLMNINTINEEDTRLYKQNTLGIEELGNACIYYQRVRYNITKIILSDSETAESSIVRIEDFTKKANECLDRYQDTIALQEERDNYTDLVTSWTEYSKHVTSMIDNYHAGKIEEVKNILFGDATTVGDALQTSFDEMMAANSSAARDKSDNNSKTAQEAAFLMIVIIAAGVIIAVALGLFISRIISKPVGRIVAAANQLALGDVNVSVAVDTKDEIGEMAEAFRSMIANIREQALIAEKMADGDLTVDVTVRSENDLLGRKLSEMVARNNEVLNNISIAAEQVSSGAKQISDSSIALSQGATEQASSVEQLTASLEEISAQTELNAKNANQANELAEVAKVNAVEGNRQMKDMQKAMEEINDSSASISKIIKVIDEIAFQTNILALNAAVEAARAGQQGKGFAVVAEEVRNLAARSANAAKETTELIEGSIHKVEAGTKLANETAGALNKIVEDVSRAAGLVNNIAAASNEQALGIAQINQGIMQVSQVVQTNSATSEESAAASEELSSQAEVLSETVKKFRLKKMDFRASKYDIVAPEVLKMLENMSDKRKVQGDAKDSSLERTGKNVTIALSDNEFGKY